MDSLSPHIVVISLDEHAFVRLVENSLKFSLNDVEAPALSEATLVLKADAELFQDFVEVNEVRRNRHPAALVEKVEKRSEVDDECSSERFYIVLLEDVEHLLEVM